MTRLNYMFYIPLTSSSYWKCTVIYLTTPLLYCHWVSWRQIADSKHCNFIEHCQYVFTFTNRNMSHNVLTLNSSLLTTYMKNQVTVMLVVLFSYLAMIFLSPWYSDFSFNNIFNLSLTVFSGLTALQTLLACHILGILFINRPESYLTTPFRQLHHRSCPPSAHW